MKMTLELDKIDDLDTITHAEGYRNAFFSLRRYITRLEDEELGQEAENILASIIEKVYDVMSKYHLPEEV